MPKREHSWLWWWIGGAALLIVAVIVVPNLLQKYHAAPPAGEASFVTSMRTICTADVSYEYANPKEGYARTLKELAAAGLIDAPLASGAKSGYRFEYAGVRGPSGRIEGYHISARPEHGGTGERSAYMDDACDIHTTKDDRAATAADPKL